VEVAFPHFPEKFLSALCSTCPCAFRLFSQLSVPAYRMSSNSAANRASLFSAHEHTGSALIPTCDELVRSLWRPKRDNSFSQYCAQAETPLRYLFVTFTLGFGMKSLLLSPQGYPSLSYRSFCILIARSGFLSCDSARSSRAILEYPCGCRSKVPGRDRARIALLPLEVLPFWFTRC